MTYITCYTPSPISFTHGCGIWLYDAQGRAYLDSLSGIAVCGLGHAHPDVTKTIQTQAAKLLHTSNGYIIQEQEKLAEKLIKMSGMTQVFFANSGAEANEAAIKLARLYGHQQGIETPTIIVMSEAFHGRTMATLTASGNRKIQAGFEPLMPGFVRAPFNDIEALHNIAHNRNDIVAIMLEPIQGEGGIRPADDQYLKAIESLCKQHNWLLILDEIQTGIGRTGKLFAYMHAEIQPDIVTSAKALGNGVPISACLMHDKACNLFKPGMHGSTFGGNPLACATALTVLDVIERDNLCENALGMGVLLKQKLMAQFGNLPIVRQIRGKGLMIGIELDRNAQDLKRIGLENGILLNITRDTVIRLLPPLVITENEIDELVKRLKICIEIFQSSTVSC